MKKTTIGGNPLFRGFLCTALLLIGGGLLMAANPPTDFQYDLNEAGDGVVIKKYLGTATAVVIPGTIEAYPVTEIGEKAFSTYALTFSSSIVSVVIPDSVTRIGDGAFSGQTDLKQVTLPRNLKVIGDEVFSNCYRQLARIVIPEGVTSIGAGAFSNTALTALTIPGSVTSIGARAFYLCEALTTLTIPGSVTSIGDNAFSRCSALTTVNITVRPVEFPKNSAFSGCTRLSLASRKKIQDCGYTGSF
ncbi:MAG: leucine-rich repeat domain-containing protein [Spirochaetaceae bacterium]|nr:leucine-rich repeat domain-containing protein [Spirochaetaceae bacterium]